jgi:hypothetical protein
MEGYIEKEEAPYKIKPRLLTEIFPSPIQTLTYVTASLLLNIQTKINYR